MSIQVDAAHEGKIAQQTEEEVMDEEEKPRKMDCAAEVGGNEEINNRFVAEISLNVALMF